MTNPEIIYYKSGQKEAEIWFLNGQYYRTNGPAVLEWFESGQKAEESWYLNGQYYRTNGPAAQEWFESGQKRAESWFLNGNNLREEPLKSWLKENGITDLRFDNWTETHQILFKLTWAE